MSNYVDEQYKKDLNYILNNGIDQDSRNGKTRSVFGLTNRYKFPESLPISSGIINPNRTPGESESTITFPEFPILTTKKIAFKSIVGELLSFIQGYTNVKDFNRMGTKVWDANAKSDYWLPHAKEAGDLGRLYSSQWRGFRGIDKNGYIKEVDQLQRAIDLIIKDPTSRKIVVSAWNPVEIEDKQMALEACHISFNFYVDTVNKRLSLSMLQRSADLFLGVPWNITSYSLLLCMVAHITEYQPYEFVHYIDNAHIYHDHFPAVLEQLNRPSHDLPALVLSKHVRYPFYTPFYEKLEEFEPNDFYLNNYRFESAIKARMNV
jgi:thymidylate synthase